MHIHKEIDTRGLNCPLPILKAKKALSDMLSGQLLKVVATDPGSTRDFQAFAKQTGNDLVDQKTVGTDFVHVLKRKKPAEAGGGSQVLLKRQTLQVFAEILSHFRVRQRQLHGGFEETFLAAAVVTFALVLQRVHGF